MKDLEEVEMKVMEAVGGVMTQGRDRTHREVILEEVDGEVE